MIRVPVSLLFLRTLPLWISSMTCVGYKFKVNNKKRIDMNYTKMKFGLKKGIVGVCILGAILLFTTPLLAQTNGKSG